MNNNRKEYLDLLKIFACFCVLADHTNCFVSTAGNLIAPNTIEYLFAFFYLTIAHVAVTLFVMISGALLLKKEESYKKILIRVIKCLSVIAIFTFIHYVADNSRSNFSNFNFKEYLLHVIHGDYIINYWYLYMYLGFLVMLPILRKLVKSLSAKDYLYIIPFTILCSFDFITRINEWFELPIFVPYLCIFIMGYFIDNYDILGDTPKKEINSAKTMITFYFCSNLTVRFLISSLFLIVDVCFVTLYSARESALDNTVSNRFFCWDNVFYIYFAIFLFYWGKLGYKSFQLSKKPFLSIIIKNIVTETYGIYLLHGTVTMLFQPVIDTFIKQPMMPNIFKWIIIDILLFIFCWTLTRLIKLIPFVKKII